MSLLPAHPARSRRGGPTAVLYVALLLALVSSGQLLAAPRASAVGVPALQALIPVLDRAPVIVRDAPQITSPAQLTTSVGQDTSFTVTTTGFPVPAISADFMPDGLTFTDKGDGTGTITGTPTTPGLYVVRLRALNDNAAAQDLTITVRWDPQFDSPSTASFAVDTPGSFVVSTTGFPPPSLTLRGALPSGLTFTDHGDGTGTIDGTPATTSAGSYPVTVTANNGQGGTSSDVSGPMVEGLADAPALALGAAALTGAATQALTIIVSAATTTTPPATPPTTPPPSTTSPPSTTTPPTPTPPAAPTTPATTTPPAAPTTSTTATAPPATATTPAPPGDTSAAPGVDAAIPGSSALGSLPDTGSPVLPWLGGGLLLLVAGAVLLVSGRRPPGRHVSG